MLTDEDIAKALPKDKSFRLFDSKGLYLEVSPRGGKWWRWKYRFQLKEKRLSFGVYPEIPINEARAMCLEARKIRRDGYDPSEMFKTRKQNLKFDKNNPDHITWLLGSDLFRDFLGLLMSKYRERINLRTVDLMHDKPRTKESIDMVIEYIRECGK